MTTRGLVAFALTIAFCAVDRDDPPTDRLIGYTEFRTALPGGRYVKADGTGRRVLAEELSRAKNYWQSVTS